MITRRSSNDYALARSLYLSIRSIGFPTSFPPFPHTTPQHRNTTYHPHPTPHHHNAQAEFYNTYTAGRVEDPYDCAKQKVDPNAGNLTKYCLQSRFYSCAMKVHCAIPEIKGGACPAADQKKLANFFPCAENAAGGHSSFSDALPCAKKWGLNVAAIEKCYVRVSGLCVVCHPPLRQGGGRMALSPTGGPSPGFMVE